MNREQILGILYDLSLTIGSEVRLDSLLKKTLLRLLFHTSFPVGVVFGAEENASAAEDKELYESRGEWELRSFDVPVRL